MEFDHGEKRVKAPATAPKKTPEKTQDLDVSFNFPRALAPGESPSEGERAAPQVPEEEIDAALDQALDKIENRMPQKRYGGNIVRDVTKQVRMDVNDFIQNNIHEPAKLGFFEKGGQTLCINDLKESLYQASRSLEEFIENDQDRTAVSISMRTFAQNLQLSVDAMRVKLTRGGFQDGVPQNQTATVLKTALAFRGELASVIQEMDAFVLRAAQAQQGPKG